MLLSIISSLNLQTLLIGLVVILIVYKVRQRWRYKLPPGPYDLPIVGNLKIIKEQFWFETFDSYAKKYGPVFSLSLGPFRTVILNDINVVTEALVKRQSDFAGRPYIPSTYKFTEGSKDIAFATYSPTWKLHRKIAGKALRNYLGGKHLEDVLHASLKKCLAKMVEEKEPFNPEPYVDLMIFNILNAFCFGESCDLDDPEFKRFMKLDKDLTESAGKGLVEDMIPYMAEIYQTKKYKKVFAMADEILSIFRKKFKDHEDTFDPGNIRDFVDTLILARKEAEDDENKEVVSQLTNTHLIQTLADIFNAGIDTSRVTLYFALRYLAGLQDIQSKVHNEIDRVVGRDRLPGIKDRENLSYCEATLHEVMRLSPAAPLGLPHSTICDTHVGGYDVPKGTMVMINFWALHRDPKHWPDPEKFDPTRFLDTNGKLGMKPESWLPFSAGRRVCLGETVAKPELHLIFASIFQRFKVTLPEGTDPAMELNGSGGMVQPAPFKIIIEERH